MISHTPVYYEIDDNTHPILIYRGDSTCYNQLNTFADELAKALIACHQSVEIIDVKKRDTRHSPNTLVSILKPLSVYNPIQM